MADRRNYTLTDAARLLAEPAHRLIYFCEKGVVVPDVKESEGRGTSRLFSARNILEFAVALRLRDARLPVEVIGAVLRLLRAFEAEVGSRIRGFRLPEGLRSAGAPDLRIVMSDGARLYASLIEPGGQPVLFGGIEIERLLSVPTHRPAPEKLRVVRPGHVRARQHGDSFGGPEGSSFARLEISVTRIARQLPLDVSAP